MIAKAASVATTARTRSMILVVCMALTVRTELPPWSRRCAAARHAGREPNRNKRRALCSLGRSRRSGSRKLTGADEAFAVVGGDAGKRADKGRVGERPVGRDPA